MATMTLVDVLCGAAAPRPAVTGPEGSVDYVALCNAADAVAAALAAHGVTPGDRVAAVLAEGPAFLAAFAGTAIARSAFAPLAGGDDALRSRLARLGPRLLIAAPDAPQSVRVAAAALGVPVITLRFNDAGTALVDGEPVYEAHGRLPDADDVALIAPDGATYTHGALVEAIAARPRRTGSIAGGGLDEPAGLIDALAVLRDGGHLLVGVDAEAVAA